MVDPKRLDALLSEYKGNLFEYLLASCISQKYNIENQFLSSLSVDVLTMLEQQEQFLRNYYSYLLIELPLLAEETASKIISYLNLNLECKPDVYLVGKVLGASNDKRFDEADILIKTGTTVLPISVKISKNSSYVNTKSGGIRTFFTKYFETFESVEIQNSFNQLCDFEYEALAIKLHELAGIEYSSGFKNWEDAGLEVLPGQLDEAYRKPLLEYYSFVNREISKNLKGFFEQNPALFINCLAPLMGHSSREIIQVTAFYNLKEQKFIKKNVLIHKMKSNQKLKGFDVRKNNFDIKFEDMALQVRVKPMNKFTSKAFKVNCSVKYF